MRWQQGDLIVVMVLVGSMASMVLCHAQTGNDLLRKCTDALRTIESGNRRIGEDQTVANTGWCSGYLNGLFYGYHAGVIDENKALELPSIQFRLCSPPQGLLVEQLVHIVVKSLRETPQSLHLPAGDLALAAMLTAFPCPASSAPPQAPTSSKERR